MRQYLKLPAGADLADLNGAFPPERCLCLIGSDFASYAVLGGLSGKGVGNFSDGLVKQDNAYIKGAYGANVHRSHSGRRGIVNSFESYQNVRRFLFGDTKVKLELEEVAVKLDLPRESVTEFYDIEFSVSIRGTGILLHQRRQNPCENALRYDRGQDGILIDPKTRQPVTEIPLHTAFMDTALRRRGDPFSHFALAFRVAQHQVEAGLLWDRDYPERTIYSETVEIRVGNEDAASEAVKVQYRWLSDVTDPEGGWQEANLGPDGGFRLPLRDAPAFSAVLSIHPSAWGDKAI